MRRPTSLPVFLFFIFLASLLQGCSEKESAVVASPNDQREYRHIQLPNQLDVLLISDPTADKAAASLDVYIGSYQNPEDRAGLVHFLEHMLFLGTEKYPDAGEYQRFISEHGGSHNAGTGLENTNYFFDIDAAYLEPALDRFAQFFSAPVFDAKYVDRERNAVESEYRLKIKDDGRRLQDVLQEQINPQHPLSKFTVGNLQTLEDRETGSVRDELLAIYKKYYSANIMKLVVLGRENLDQLQAMVEPRFALVENTNVTVDIHKQPFFQPDSLPRLVSALPLQDSRKLSLSFPIPKMLPHWQAKPASYLAALIGHEGDGSLLDVLKKRGWAESLGAGLALEDRGSALFSVDIGLTPAGYNNRDRVVEMFFAWVALIRNQGIERWRYEQQSKLNQIAFRFQEKQNPVSYVYSLASMMQRYPVGDVLQANFVMNDFDRKLISKVAGMLTVDNLFMQLTAPDIEADRISQMYQTPYSVTAIAESKLASWRAPGDFAELALPLANPYIPENLDLLPDIAEVAKPRLLVAEEAVTAWHLQDTRFGVPKAHIVARLESTGMDSPQVAAALELYLAYVEDQLGAKVYPATEAGLSFSLQPNGVGFNIIVGGYSDRQLALLEDILAALKNPRWQQERFDRIQQTMARELANHRRDYPFRQIVASLYAMLKGQWTPLQKAAAVSQLSMLEVKDFARRLNSNLRLRLLVSGNHDRSAAEAIVATLSAWADFKPLQSVRSVALLDPGYHRGQIPVDHSDAAVMLYLQGRDDSLLERAHLLLVGEMISAPFYTSLRTEKQLGYVVAAFANNHLRVPGLAMLVQSPGASESQLEAEFRGFLAAYAEQLSQMTEEDLQRYKISVLSNLRETPKNLAELNSRFMESLDLGYPEFDFRDQLAVQLDLVTLESFSNAYTAVALNQVRGILVETADADSENSAVDLRRQGRVYSYQF